MSKIKEYRKKVIGLLSEFDPTTTQKIFSEEVSFNIQFFSEFFWAVDAKIQRLSPEKSNNVYYKPIADLKEEGVGTKQFVECLIDNDTKNTGFENEFFYAVFDPKDYSFVRYYFPFENEY